MKRFEKTKGFIIGVLATLLLFNGMTAIAATPTTKKNIDVYYGYTVYVDGIKFEPTDKNGVIEPFSYGGWIYAPFEHIAKALGKEAYWDSETRSLYLGKRAPDELPQNNNSPEQLSTANDEKYGKLSGNLTWQYNKAIGTKPDVGAKAIIIPKNFERTDDMYLLKLDALTLSFNNYGIYSAKADGYGKYIIDDIPIGDYYILLVSQNAHNDLSIREDLIVNFRAQSELKDLFGADIYSKMESSLKLYKHAFDTVTIKEDKETVKSYDFGYSYF